MIRVYIADDHPLIRDGLQTIINLQPNMEVAGVAGDGKQAYEEVSILKPDVVLMDIQMPIMNGIECMKRIKNDAPGTIVIILTTFSDEEYIVEGLANGASGFMLKNLSAEKIVETIQDAMNGQLILPNEVAVKLSAHISHLSKSMGPAETKNPSPQTYNFTKREKQVIQCMVEGKSNREIAELLYISEGTVKNYITVIYQKIGTNDRTKAVLLLKDILKGMSQ